MLIVLLFEKAPEFNGQKGCMKPFYTDWWLQECCLLNTRKIFFKGEGVVTEEENLRILFVFKMTMVLGQCDMVLYNFQSFLYMFIR